IRNVVIVIGENGGYMVRKEVGLVSTTMARKTTEELLRLIYGIRGTYPVLCIKSLAYLTYQSHDLLGKLSEYYKEYRMVEDLMDYQGEVLKIAVYHEESSEKYIYPVLRSLEKYVKVKVSGANWLDISHQNAHKGHALQK